MSDSDKDKEQGTRKVTGLVIVTHGLLAEGLRAAAEMITGPQPSLETVAMGPAADVDALADEVQTAVARAGGPGNALILVDMFGGSPANATAYVALAGTPAVCGVNLPMLLEVLMNRERMGAEELVGVALRAGEQGVVNLIEELRS